MDHSAIIYLMTADDKFDTVIPYQEKDSVALASWTCRWLPARPLKRLLRLAYDEHVTSSPNDVSLGESHGSPIAQN